MLCSRWTNKCQNHPKRETKRQWTGCRQNAFYKSKHNPNTKTDHITSTGECSCPSVCCCCRTGVVKRGSISWYGSDNRRTTHHVPLSRTHARASHVLLRCVLPIFDLHEVVLLFAWSQIRVPAANPYCSVRPNPCLFCNSLNVVHSHARTTLRVGVIFPRFAYGDNVLVVFRRTYPEIWNEGQFIPLDPSVRLSDTDGQSGHIRGTSPCRENQ